MAELDTQALVQDVSRDSASGMGSRYMDAGRSAGRGLLSSGPDTFSQNLGGSDQAMGQAIRAKYMQKYSQGERKLAHEMNKAGQNDYLKKLAVTSDLANQEHQLNVQKEMLKQKQKAAKKAARGQIVGQVLGIAGAVVGGVASLGNPAAIYAGYQVGNAAGNAAGSS